MTLLPSPRLWNGLLKGIASLVGCALIGTGSAGAQQEKSADPAWFSSFEALNYQGSLPYRLLKPTTIEPGKAYPLLVFLHGAGERGNDNVAQFKHAVGDIVKHTSGKYSFFMLVPQCDKGKRWVEVDWGLDSHVMPEKPSESMAAAMGLIDELLKKFPIDSKRIYIAGISMGGFGTWDAISRYPDKFAAAVPVCGGADNAQASKLVNIPIWAFHGDKDTTVKTHRSRDIIEAIKQAGGTPKYTEFPGVSHGSWGPAFATPELYDWLFTQSKK